MELISMGGGGDYDVDWDYDMDANAGGTDADADGEESDGPQATHSADAGTTDLADLASNTTHNATRTSLLLGANLSSQTVQHSKPEALASNRYLETSGDAWRFIGSLVFLMTVGLVVCLFVLAAWS